MARLTRTNGAGSGVPIGVDVKDVPGLEGKYLAGTDGHIYCLSDSKRAARKPRPFRLSAYGAPYRCVTTIIGGRRVRRSLHVMVCLAFHGAKPSPTREVRHLDGDPDNTQPDNLQWGTQSENEADKRRHGRVAEGERHGAAKLTEEGVRIIRYAMPRGLWNPADAAKVFGVLPSTIRGIVSGRAWRHVVTGPAQIGGAR